MVGNLLIRGMIVGLVAALLSFGFARTFGEPPVEAAISFEEQKAKAAGETPEPELVSRETQAGIGLLTALTVYGAAVGGIFSLIFSFAYGRLGHLGARGTSAVLAVAAYIAIVVVPQMKYPANPPAVGSPETIDIRTKLYFGTLLISIIVMAAAFLLARQLWNRYGGWNATIIAGLSFIIVMALVAFAMPPINEVPEDFSAGVLWQFRISTYGIHTIFWLITGLAFGMLAERRLRRQTSVSA